MKHSAGTYTKAYAQNIKKLKKIKYWKLGYKAAAKGLTRHDNPYKLSEKILELIKKRTYWDLGWEEKAYTPTKGKLRAEEKAQAKEQRRKEKQAKRERRERRKHKHKHKHKDRKHRHRDS